MYTICSHFYNYERSFIFIFQLADTSCIEDCIFSSKGKYLGQSDQSIQINQLRMKDQNSLRQRKQSLNRLPANVFMKNTSSSTELKRRGASLTKKCMDTEQVYHSCVGKYLIGWGRIPFFPEKGCAVQIIEKDIKWFDSGQEHAVFINSSNQTYGIGSNQFGQLGVSQCSKSKNEMVRIFEKLKLKNIYCTQFCTFIITMNNELYGCGLNNRGQLGVTSQNQHVFIPTLIQKLSEYRETQTIKRSSSRSRITSVYYQQLNKQRPQFGQDRAQTCYNSSLELRQTIVDIRGGPLHTVVLTSKGRIFYTGNLYKGQSLTDDQFTSEFIELNTSKFGRIQSIRCSLTGICFLTLQNRLYLLGYFTQNLFNEPEMIEGISVQSFDLNEHGVYAVDGFGDLFFFSTERNIIRGQKLSIQERIEDVHCGLDFALAVGKSGKVYGRGDNSQKQLSCDNNQSCFTDFTKLEINLNSDLTTLKCCNNFVLTLVSEFAPVPGKAGNELCRVKDLERQNKILKQLLCNKNKKSIKIQTQKESKFDLPNPLNARTFDTSMQIPFQQLKLGKQISEGGYGIIFKATWRRSTVAVKIFKIQIQNQNAVRDFISECHAMEALRHPNIVMFLGACTKPPHFAIVLEYCEGGTIWALLQKQSQELSWEERRDLALDVARGMNYLHERTIPILHRDLKSLNLLLDHKRRVKLADFGWTKGLQNYMTGKIGTYQWMAPEVISAYQYTEKADVFSFGIILWQMASRQAPYRNIPGPQVAQDVLTKDLRPTVPKKTPEMLANLMRRCWDKDPGLRPSFNQIISSLQDMHFI